MLNEDMYYEVEPLQPLGICKALYAFDGKHGPNLFTEWISLQKWGVCTLYGPQKLTFDVIFEKKNNSQEGALDNLTTVSNRLNSARKNTQIQQISSDNFVLSFLIQNQVDRMNFWYKIELRTNDLLIYCFVFFVCLFKNDSNN